MDNEYKKKKVTTGGKKENKRQESKKITIKVGVFFDGRVITSIMLIFTSKAIL